MNKNLLILLGIFSFFCTEIIGQTLTWQLKFAPRARHITAAHILGDGTFYAFGGSPRNDSIQSIFSSIDSGKSWKSISDAPFKPQLKDASFASQSIAYAVGDAASILKSTDGGKTWTNQSVVANLRTRQFNGIHCITSDTAYIVGGNLSNDSITTMLRTVNGGMNWQKKIDNPGPRLNDIHFYKNMHGIAVGDKGTIFTTTDGGINWGPKSISGNAGSRTFNAARFLNKNTIIIVGGHPINDSIQTILRSTDGGNTWQTIKDNLDPMLNDIDFLDDGKTGIAVGNDETAYSTIDTGKTWTKITLPNGAGGSNLNSINYTNATNAIIGGQFGSVFIALDKNALSNERFNSQTHTLLQNPVYSYSKINNTANYKEFTLISITGKATNIPLINSNTLDFSKIPKGVYILTFKTQSGQQFHQKIQKL